MRFEIPAFDTARLEIRRLSKADESLYCSIYSCADTMGHICEPLTPARAAQSFRAAVALSDDAARAPQFFALLDRPTRSAIGMCSIQPFDAVKRRAEVGILVKPEKHGQGYGYETIAALLRQAFSALPIDAVWVQYHPANVAADRLFAKLGFQLPGKRETDFGNRLPSVRIIHRAFFDSSTLQNEGEETHVERDRVF